MKNGGSLTSIGLCCIGFCMLAGCVYVDLSRKMPGCNSGRVGLIAFFGVLFLSLLLLTLWALVRRKFKLAIFSTTALLVSYCIYGVGIVPGSVILYENKHGTK
jgi:hypothetical protein